MKLKWGFGEQCINEKTRKYFILFYFVKEEKRAIEPESVFSF
jgi:hypothetical protein